MERARVMIPCGSKACSVSIAIYTFIYICIYIYLHAFIYICIHTCTYINVYIQQRAARARDHRAVRIEGVQRQHRALLF